MDKYQEKALESWYKEGHILRLDPRHPLIKLAGEAGELLDLYGKHEYKPGFSWLKCKHCNYSPEKLGFGHGSFHDYTPLVLDELGDIWYYLRILSWQLGENIEEWMTRPLYSKEHDILNHLASLSERASVNLCNYVWFNKEIKLFYIFTDLINILRFFDYSLDELTELNYQKLNSEPTQHGWASAREIK